MRHVRLSRKMHFFFVRIAADMFIKHIFKGNTVTDRDSAPYRTSRSIICLHTFNSLHIGSANCQ